MPAIEVKPVPFPDLLPEIRQLYRAMARRKGIEFAIEIDADVPPAIVTDRLRLQGLLHSLIASAFEFTHEGRVALRIRRARGGAPEATVIAFDIVDTGIVPGRLRNAVEAVRKMPDAIAQGCDGAALPIARVAALLGGYLAWSGKGGEENILRVYLPLMAGAGLPHSTAIG